MDSTERSSQPNSTRILSYLIELDKNLPEVVDYQKGDRSSLSNRIDQVLQNTAITMPEDASNLWENNFGLTLVENSDNTEEDRQKIHDWEGKITARTLVTILIDELAYSPHVNILMLPQARSIIREKSGYSQYDSIRPSHIGIGSPKFNQEKGFLTNERMIRGLAHESSHAIRMLMNTGLWQENHSRLGLDYSEATKGYKSPNSYRGSEAIGDLASHVMLHYFKTGNLPKVSDILPYVAYRAVKTRENYEIGSTLHTRYFAARVELLEFIARMCENGYGDLPAVTLLSAGCCGYVSLESLPFLVDKGIIKSEKIEYVESLWEKIAEWMRNS